MTDGIGTARTDDLRPYPDNARNGDTDAIIESIRANGFFRPLVISADDVVLAGNHAYAAAMELGIAEVPVFRVPHLADSPEATKIVLADNRTSDRARYDDGLLLQLLRSIEDDLYGTGFVADDLSSLAALADVGSYYDSMDYTDAAFARADAARRTITITDVPEDLWEWWMAQEGKTDLDRLRSLR